MNRYKKIFILLGVFLIVLMIVVILLIKGNKAHYYSELDGRWVSNEDTLIKTIKEYENGQPVYADDNASIVTYYLDIKKDGKYFLYYSDVEDLGRSDYSIEKNILEKGNYNFDINENGIIYFSPGSNDDGYIWKCELQNDNELHNCNRHATIFMKQLN